MPITAQKKIVFYAKPQLVALLEAETARTGASVSEVCRRALLEQLLHVLSMKTQAESAEYLADIKRRSVTAPVLIAGPRD
jgi:hypothetical protein